MKEKHIHIISSDEDFSNPDIVKVIVNKEWDDNTLKAIGGDVLLDLVKYRKKHSTKEAAKKVIKQYEEALRRLAKD